MDLKGTQCGMHVHTTSCYTVNGTPVCCYEVTAVLDICCTLAMPPRTQLCYVRLGCFLQATHLEDWEMIEEEHSNALNGCMEALESAILRVPVTGGARVRKASKTTEILALLPYCSSHSMCMKMTIFVFFLVIAASPVHQRI